MLTTLYCLLCKHVVRNLFQVSSLVSEWPCTITAMEGKGGPEDVKEEEKEGDTREGVKVEEGENTATKDVDGVISLEGKEEVGLQRKCLTGWINYQLSRHPRPPQGRVTDILHDLRSGLLLISLLEVKTKPKNNVEDQWSPRRCWCQACRR